MATVERTSGSDGSDGGLTLPQLKLSTAAHRGALRKCAGAFKLACGFF